MPTATPPTAAPPVSVTDTRTLALVGAGVPPESPPPPPPQADSTAISAAAHQRRMRLGTSRSARRDSTRLGFIGGPPYEVGACDLRQTSVCADGCCVSRGSVAADDEVDAAAAGSGRARGTTRAGGD